MMIPYEPLSEEEAIGARFNLMEEGIYDAHVYQAEARQSKSSNNPMIELKMNVYDKNGNIHIVNDYLLFTRNMIWKLKHFCDSASLSKEYMAGQFCPEIASNKAVKVKIKIQAGNEIPADKLQGKLVGSKYPDKNVVDDYVVSADPIMIPYKSDSNDFINDDIPF